MARHYPVVVFYACEECGHEFEVSVWPDIPATWVNPPEAGEIKPECCPECGTEIDFIEAREEAAYRAMEDE